MLAEFAESWYCRALREADGIDRLVVLSMFAHALEDWELLLLVKAVFGVPEVKAPFLGTAGKVDKRGRICADLVFEDGTIEKQWPLYESETTFRDAMRRLADRLNLDDHQRLAMFVLCRKWIVCDYRLDPTMDPRDPDAKRLTADGNGRLAHH